MDRREAQQALKFARQWHLRSLLPTASLVQLEKEYGPAANDSQAESFGSAVLYGLGGILLGAAAFALLVLLEDNGVIDGLETAGPWILLAWGIACSLAAFAVDLVAKRPALGDALHVAALVAITGSGFPNADELPLGFLGIAYAAGVLAYRRVRFLVPFLALVALNVSLVSILFGNLARHASEEAALTIWFPYAITQVAFLVLASRTTKWPWPTFSLAAATLLMAGTFLGYYFDVVDELWTGFRGDVEVLLAILMGVALAAGLGLREKGLVLASALVVAIDAVVFAFDVGQLVGGLVAILAVAALLIWQAGALRRYLRE